MKRIRKGTIAIQKSRRHISMQKLAPVGILLVLVVCVSIGNPKFLRWNSINSIFQQIAATGIVAMGAMVVLLTGGLDFTSGNGLAMCGVFAGVMYFNFGESMFSLVFAGIALGACLGFVNGFLITKCNLKPFVATLATMAFTQGLTLLISEGRTAFLNHPLTFEIGGGNLFGVLSIPFVIFLCVALLTSYILNHTRFGTYIYAIGGNEEAARFVGINVTKYKWLAYIFAGICTGTASVIAICRVGQIAPNLEGTYLMDGIAAAIIGGTSPSGGRGKVFGTIIGVLILGVVSSALTFLRVTSTAQTAVKGLIILLAIVIDSLFNLVKKD